MALVDGVSPIDTAPTILNARVIIWSRVLTQSVEPLGTIHPLWAKGGKAPRPV